MDDQLVDKDYATKHSNDLYFVDDNSDPLYSAGIAQFFNCSLKSSGVEINCGFTMNGDRFMVSKVTARIVNNYLQLMAVNE